MYQGLNLSLYSNNPSEIAIDDEHKIARIGHVADVLAEWFSVISKQARKKGKDAFCVLFGPPGSDKTPNDNHLHLLLFRIKIFIERAIELNDLDRAGALRKFIILIHEILHALFVALTLEAGMANANSVLVVKSLLFCFFQVDFSEALQALLTRTTGKQFVDPKPDDAKEENSAAEHARQARKPELRLSYEAVMKIYAIYLSLANCPIDLILVDKVSLSLDITTPEDMSPNTYTRFLELLDFSKEKTFAPLTNRLVSQLAAIFNYYYELSPDILRHSLRHSSFFGWVTGNTLSPRLYLSTDTTLSVTSFAKIALDPVDPYFYEVDLYEHKKRIKVVGKETDSVAGVRSPSYLAITFQMFQLLHNRTFTKELVSQTNSTVCLLDIWLCVSSYVHHYQYRSAINTYGARVSFLMLLKLTSPKAPWLLALRARKIDENKWKLCHHKHPVIPLDENCPEKDALLYVIDLLQITFRYNLSKRLDMENVKIALTVLYQVLLELEAHPTEGLRTYSWNDLYVALVYFMKFVARSQNEEAVKYVIEEFFSILQLLLSPAFDKILEKSTDYFSLGYHPAKSMNFDLLYIMLQQHDTLEALFSKFIRRKKNFGRVERAFLQLKEKISSVSDREISDSEVTRILNELSLLDEENMQLTTITIDRFNYAETFKYLDRDYEDFSKQRELMKTFISIFETDWVGDASRNR
ncbi:hypothetical protein METBIDRAFT_40875 [Metschnikowia bicuspidata var. bicuspidata NRRL YB-4993]|uniref:Armadillo-like helical domain-containing protein n=1 Tax=Metschnikowia bicuspidata var. bicuspidata NRRL YB-4993 TaxID=869754 RepID=A0A1A0HC08_9ASCO|nr:hypothetical protein METBIDRAFT_40875 [Metschnikowia bicuspidata var. bicuspidata NRRL YB-4993]OBA21546.1 hypothetical protein METBIDRAFT_40875 [Metschnikowia bicuspidata var. bicuspidata NRRL YB-4993]